MDDLVLMPGEEDDPVAAPGSATGTRSIGQDLRRASRRLDTLQLSLGKESDRRAISRPEELDGIVGARKGARLERTERTDPDRAFPAGGMGDECDLATVR